ncbi:EspA/EspE family type VII secretion system effector [Mycobacterium sp. PS03-16]|uniref:EspA/EspE family type VII secretion system effector n=1 Tax=Mycobacterium sp. PS03-16 TaxID=2559611 RepID=UPI001072FB6B|nr:EspA/EspE family type VII secretion system effector [Mycobacterium sp. PS03-16]
MIEGLFAGKGIVEHIVGAADGDPFAILGLRADLQGVGQTVLEEVLKRKAPQHLGAIATPIINGGLLGINAMQLLCGLTFESDKGEKFAAGGQSMSRIGQMLQDATPDGGWSGSGSEAYSRLNVRQQQRAQQIARTDAQVARIIETQAGQVKTTKEVLDVSATVLTAAIPVVLATRLIPPPPIVGIPMATAMEIGAVAGALLPCTVAMQALQVNALQNSTLLQEAIAQYLEVAGQAKPTGGKGGKAVPKHTDAPPVDNDEAPPSAAPPVPPAVPASPVPVPPVVPSGGGGAASGGGGPSGGGAPTPSTPMGPPPAMPRMPAVSGGGYPMSAPSGGGMPGGMAGGAPAAQPGGAAGGGLGGLFAAIASIVNTAVQAGQQHAAQQSAQQEAKADKGTDAEPEPEEQPANAAAAEPDSAAAGAPGERAPVDAAHGTEQEAPLDIPTTRTL